MQDKPKTKAEPKPETKPEPRWFTIGTNRRHKFVVRRNDLNVRLEIDPTDKEEDVDGYTFTLRSTDGTYEQVKTVADDKIKGDTYVDLEYEKLIAGLRYTLEVKHEDGLTYNVLEDVHFREIFRDGQTE